MRNLSVFYRRFKNFIKRDYRDKLLFFHAYILCGIARGLIIYVSFKKIRNYIGIYNEESSFEMETSQYKQIRKIAWAVNKASNYTPWESKCLVKALTAQRLLLKQNIYSTLYLGIAKEGEKTLKAHAWLRSGEIIVTGGYEANCFKEVAKFSNEK